LRRAAAVAPRGHAGTRLLGALAVEVRQRPGDIDHGDAHGSAQVQQGTPFRMVFASSPGSGSATGANVTRNVNYIQ
jgi:hypothetical protein